MLVFILVTEENLCLPITMKHDLYIIHITNYQAKEAGIGTLVMLDEQGGKNIYIFLSVCKLFFFISYQM